MLRCSGIVIGLLMTANSLDAGPTVSFFIRAFIPNEHPTNIGYMKRLPNSQTAVQGPPFDEACYLGDNRGFSSDVFASSRLITEFSIEFEEARATLSKRDGRDMVRTGATHRVSCETGSPVQPSEKAVPRAHFGTPAFHSGQCQMVFDAKANNPSVIASPDIHYGGSITYDSNNSKLRFEGDIGAFPAFEAYASIDGGPLTTVFQEPPSPSSNIISLIDAAGHFNTRRVDVTVSLPGPLEGKWLSQDPRGRFQFSINGTTAVWTERNESGNLLNSNVRVTRTAGGNGWQVVRNNDEKVLEFLGFPAATRGSIISKNPKPSYMNLAYEDGKLSGEWNGLLVTKDKHGHVNGIKQPGETQPKPFVFTNIK